MQIIEKIKTKKTIVFLALLMLAAFSVRVYNFSDWLVFKADQSRDAAYTKEVFDKGLGHLRLLGPKIEVVHIEGDISRRGEPLQLGPFYYYQQFISAVIMGSLNPWVFALCDLILSVLAIGLFYLFLKIYFSKKITWVLTILFAFSFYLIQYSRFAWNPNQIIFWELLLVLGLYKSVFEKNSKKAGWWAVAVIVSYAVMSQLHIITLFGFLPVILGFWSIYRPKKVTWKYWIIGLVTALVLYMPVIVSEIVNDADNTKRFVAVLGKDRNEYSFTKKLSKLADRYGEFSAIAITSFHEREMKEIECIGSLFFLLSSFLLVLIAMQEKVENLIAKVVARFRFRLIFNWREKVPPFSPFIVLILIWIISMSVVYYKVVNDLNRARYFLAIAPIVFIFLGLWFELTKRNFPQKIYYVIIYSLALAFLLCNLWAVAYWYSSLARFKSDERLARSPKMGYHDEQITLNSMKGSIDYMVSQANAHKKRLCFFSTDYQYNTSFEYLLDLYYPQVDYARFNQDTLRKDCVFFVIARLKNGKDEIPREMDKFFDIGQVERIGALNIWSLQYNQEAKSRLEKLITDEQEDFEIDNDPRVKNWSEVFELIFEK
jgi:hypothetical protein